MSSSSPTSYLELVGTPHIVGKPVARRCPSSSARASSSCSTQVYQTGEAVRRRSDAGRSQPRRSNGRLERGFFDFVSSRCASRDGAVEGMCGRRLRRDRRWRGRGSTQARSGQPREGRVPGHARPRAAQPAGADPDGAAADAAARRRSAPTRSARSSSARSRTWCAWSTTCSTSRASRAARSSCSASDVEIAERRGAGDRDGQPADRAAPPRAARRRARASGLRGRRRSDAARRRWSSNLLTNAAKYTEPWTADHRAAARRGDDGSCSRVRDTGIGIDRAMLPGMSSTCSCRTARRSTGRRAASGSAWRSCAAWCELHGGSVSAHSGGRGHGSEFIVLRLPAAPTQAAAAGRAGGRRRWRATGQPALACPHRRRQRRRRRSCWPRR